MIKLPKCPHCDKILVPVITDSFVQAGNLPYANPRHERSIIYLCPEKVAEQNPEWVEVLEID